MAHGSLAHPWFRPVPTCLSQAILAPSTLNPTTLNPNPGNPTHRSSADNRLYHVHDLLLHGVDEEQQEIQ